MTRASPRAKWSNGKKELRHWIARVGSRDPRDRAPGGRSLTVETPAMPAIELLEPNHDWAKLPDETTVERTTGA